jgi:hypothetical protein
LAAALDALFEEWSSMRQVTNEITGEPFSIDFNLTTKLEGWSASLSFRSQHADWETCYDQCRITSNGSDPPMGHKRITVQVPSASLATIASCIGDKDQPREEHGGAGA